MKLGSQVSTFLILWSLVFGPLIGIPTAEAKSGAARALIVKGDAKVVGPDGKEKPLKKMEWIPEGSTIKTGPKSFARLVFVDKSTINVAAKSEMKIQKFDGKDAGVVNLAFGRIRSKVIKHTEQKDKTKLYIKTKVAAMGIRGTDFQVIHNLEKNNTNLVTFEGEVRFAKIDAGAPRIDSSYMEQRISSPDASVVKQGQMSVVNEKVDRASPPIRINPAQLDAMEKNVNMETSQKSQGKKKLKVMAKMLTAPGVVEEKSGGVESVMEVLSENIEGSDSFAQEAIAEASPQSEGGREPASLDAPPAGGGLDVPTEGGFVDLATGEYIEPPSDAPIDPNTGMAVVDGDVDLDTGEVVQVLVDEVTSAKEAEQKLEKIDQGEIILSADEVADVVEKNDIDTGGGEFGGDQRGPDLGDTDVDDGDFDNQQHFNNPIVDNGCIPCTPCDASCNQIIKDTQSAATNLTININIQQ